MNKNIQKNVLLSINIDHVATLRNARGGEFPEPILAAKEAIRAGSNYITAHLREDRRHIKDKDMYALYEKIQKEKNIGINMEMAATNEMIKIASQIKPSRVCLVPEKRQELTTEGGLDVVNNVERLQKVISKLQESGITVSVFIEPCKEQIEVAHKIGADVVELHTGTYAELADSATKQQEINRITTAARLAIDIGIQECHAGHGLSYNNLDAIAVIPEISCLHIGYSVIADSLFMGIYQATKRIRKLLDSIRSE